MSLISPMRPTGCSDASVACVSGACIGDLMIPGDTAFTRMPAFAYSIASDFVAAFNPPFVSDASTDGTFEVATSLAETLPDVAAMRLERKGRGLALRTAWSASTARVVAYLDVDLSTDLAGLAAVPDVRHAARSTQHAAPL